MKAHSEGKHRWFQLFWLGNTVSQFGDRISELALPLIAVALLHTNAAETATLVAVIWLPNVISPVVGAWADTRTDKRRLLIAADLLRAAALLSLPAAYLFAHLTLWNLLLVGILTGIGQMLFDVTYPAFFMLLVPRSYYVVANSKLSTSRSASFVLGPALGGILIDVLSAPLAVLVDTITFLFSAACISRIKITESEGPPDSESSLGQRLREGLVFNIRHPIVHACLGCSATMNFFMFIGQGLLILFANRVLGLSAGAIGLALGVGAVGGLLVAVVTKKVIDAFGLGRTMMLGALFYPLPLLLLATVHGPHWLNTGVVGVTECLSGMGLMLYDIANNSLKAAVIPQWMRSRAAGAYNAVNYGTRPLGALVGGWLGTAIGLRATLITAAVGGVLGCLWLLASPIVRIATLPEAADRVAVGAEKS